MLWKSLRNAKNIHLLCFDSKVQINHSHVNCYFHRRHVHLAIVRDGCWIAFNRAQYLTLRACLEVRLFTLRALPLGAHGGKVECRGDCAAEQAVFLLHREGGCGVVVVLPEAVAI
jgi:hypothetical protein